MARINFSHIISLSFLLTFIFFKSYAHTNRNYHELYSVGVKQWQVILRSSQTKQPSIEPILINLIEQREILTDEVNYYDISHIRANNIKRLKILTSHSKYFTDEVGVGIEEIYDYDTTGNLLKYEKKWLKKKDFILNEFIYEKGKLNYVICFSYSEFNNFRTVDTFLVSTDNKNKVSGVIPLTKTTDRCLPSYSFTYNSENKLSNIIRTLSCDINDSTMTRFYYDNFGRVAKLSKGKCNEAYFARDDKGRVCEVIEIRCYERTYQNLYVSNRTYDDAGNLRTINTDIHELGENTHHNIRIKLKYGVSGVTECLEKHNRKIFKTINVSYELF